MALLKLAALGALGYAGYKAWERGKDRAPAAFAGNQRGKRVRDAGPGAMRDAPRSWTKADEESDQSFPASDPPANY